MSIVKLGSFSEAAQQLGYTQSSVTSHIQLLEKELGTRLFERLGHSLMLTADGERLYGYAERMVRLDDEAHAELERQTEPEGILSLGMSESIASYHLNQVLTEYVRLYPKVKLRLQLGIGSSLPAFCGVICSILHFSWRGKFVIMSLRRIVCGRNRSCCQWLQRMGWPSGLV